MSGASPDAGLLDAARAWADDDPDPLTRAELQEVLARAEAGDAAAAADLADRFAGLLQFGTAGLRGALGAGPNRMNRAVVIRAAAGLAAYLNARLDAEQERSGHRPTGRVVVGFDARHRSDEFARDTASVMAGAGIDAMVLPRPLPTPVLAFAVRHLGCHAGVMVTASHNPPQDNGYKVYLGGEGHEGSQIVPPADQEIAAAIAAVRAVADVYRPDDGWVTLDEEVHDAYLDAAAGVAAPGGPRDLDIVLTPLHGVGGDSVVEALGRAGFGRTYVVPEQAEPDPDFPTVAFPNPEEPGAIDLALAAARERGADLVIANDPDADRCAVAVRDPRGPEQTGGWRMLHGDEVGALLGEHIARRGVGEGAVYANSIVSSRLLARVAAAHGIAHVETLTGFKWISRVPGLRFGYEEALGYCVDPDAVRDKDGISAAVLVAEAAAVLKAQGRSLLDLLDDLARTHGVHLSGQLSVRVADLSLITDAMARLRATPPATLAGHRVVTADDLAAGDGGLPPTDALRYLTAAGDRVIVRPSGTEPKLKCYLEAVVPVAGEDNGGGDGLAAAREEAAGRLAALRSDMAAALGLQDA
ncbi:phospho-sugar mutase [Quadrisphaera sp. GCM10027208]|uniref:phospho-sugar mutase n=1 Tax=Quadrisphaera sp. GCM10027208 TaxID=3273423 RepID=UPI0036145366